MFGVVLPLFFRSMEKKTAAPKSPIAKQLDQAEALKAKETKARQERRDLVSNLRHARAGGYLTEAEKKRLAAVSRGLGKKRR